MKNILLIGVGGTGSSAVDILYQKIREFGNMTNNKISAVVFDTDAGCVQGITAAQAVTMADTAGVGTVCDRLGRDILSEWFPCDEPSVRAQEMIRGASQWRKKSYLAFLNAMNKQASYTAFTRALEKVAGDSSASVEVYVIASIAGGTGSGSFIPIALFAKQYLRAMGKDPIVNAMVALPDIYSESQSADNKIKIFANAYAILRELNAINQVARGYNREVFDTGRARSGRKKAPIRLVIGSARAKEEKNQNVGLLFDSMNDDFWTPEAAPFQQIFLLDRIPGIHSIRAHDIILANSLYTVLCTDIGAEFDSEYSNHATLVSQNNGSNAIYAGISTAQLRFPKETLLDYLAHEKTMRVSQDEWLVLHRATEETICEKEMRAKEARRHFTMGDGDYAKLLLAELDNQRELQTSNVSEIVDRSTAMYDDEGRRLPNTTADRYFDALSSAINTRVSTDETVNTEGIMGAIAEKAVTKRPWFLARRELRSTVVANYSELVVLLTGYFSSCVEMVKEAAGPLSEAILTFNKNKDPRANEELSLITNLLMKDGRYVHPVTAMVQLCRFKKRLVDALKVEKSKDWHKINTGADVKLPLDYMVSRGTLVTGESGIPEYESRFKPSKSAYLRGGESFSSFKLTTTTRTDAYTDNAYLISDAIGNLESIRQDAVKQLKALVFLRLSQYVDVLIERYREFFRRFDEARVDLAESTKMVRRRDCGKTDSVLNVLSSEKERIAIMNEALGNSVEDEADVIASDDVAGKSVFSRCYEEAAVEITGDVTRTENLPSFFGLFDGMIAAYAATIAKKNAVYKDLDKLDVFQAIRESCRRNGNYAGYEAAFKEFLTSALEIARPSLIVTPRKHGDNSPDPKDVMVVMMSENTARHLKYDADKYELNVPAEGVSESHILASCAEQFIGKYTGDSSVRVAVVKGIPDHMLYFTGEKMDITPLRIAKFDEMSRDPVYYNNYKRAVDFSERYNTDMWNPHLGYNLHKRGYLPYMNEAMEDLCDEKLFKALFYAIDHEKIIYRKGTGRMNSESFRYFEAGAEKPILGSDGHLVNRKNVAQLVAWLRNQDALVDEWSNLFDKWIDTQKRDLPNLVVESQKDRLKAEITKSPFTRMLRSSFFAEKGSKVGSDGEKEGGMGILEFAWTIKTSEESMRDCDDAERILRVANKLFYEFCAFKVKPEVNPVVFGEIYMQQLTSLFLALAKGSTVTGIKKQSSFDRQGENAKQFFNAMVSWVNDTGNFLAVPDGMLDESGNLAINAPFVPTAEIENALEARLDKPEKPVEKTAEKTDGKENAQEDKGENA